MKKQKLHHRVVLHLRPRAWQHHALALLADGGAWPAESIRWLDVGGVAATWRGLVRGVELVVRVAPCRKGAGRALVEHQAGGRILLLAWLRLPCSWRTRP
jgi:hypothetical protein